MSLMQCSVYRLKLYILLAVHGCNYAQKGASHIPARFASEVEDGLSSPT